MRFREGRRMASRLAARLSRLEARNPEPDPLGELTREQKRSLLLYIRSLLENAEVSDEALLRAGISRERYEAALNRITPEMSPTAGEGESAQQVQYRCPSATVVWVNEHSHIYHFPGTHDYGNTKRGAYMCEADAQAAGNRAAMNEKHP